MSFSIYPDAATATLLGKPASAPIELAPNEAMGKFVPLAQHVGPDPAAGGVQTTFIRISASNIPNPQAAQPTFELLAHDPDRPDGSPPPPLDPAKAVDIKTAVELRDDVNGTGAALAYFSPPVRNQVYLLKVAIEIPGTSLWLRITNTSSAPDGDDPCDFVWVVADSDADSQQPWIHATFDDQDSAQVNFNVSVGQTSPETDQTIEINNFGTGPFTIVDITPAVTSPYTISGLPVTVGPNPGNFGKVKFGFNAPGAPGDIAPKVFSFVLSGKSDSGPFGSGHNNQIVLGAHISSNVWSSKAALPSGRSGLALAAASNGKIYAIGGFGDGRLDIVEEYTPATDSWATKASMPIGGMSLGVAAAGNGKLYAIGGGDFFRNFVAPVREYDPLADHWVTRAIMPTLRFELGVALAGNGKIYAVGGMNFDADLQKFVTLATVEEYDPATDHWAIKRPMPFARHGFGLAAGRNGRLYAVGGFAEQFAPRQVPLLQEYNPATDSWTTMAPMPTARDGLGFTFAANGKLYAVGGRKLSGESCSDVEEYDPATDSWAIKAPMRTRRLNLAVAVAGNGKLYAVGGNAAFNPNVLPPTEECTLP